MAVILETTRVYLDARRCGVVTCPKCGVTWPVNLTHYKGELGGKDLKVKCAACATVVSVRFDFHLHHRVSIQLPGSLLQQGTKHLLASITVTSLSVSGVGCALSPPLPVQSEESYDVIFFLDDPHHALICETVVIRRVQDEEVGVEFCLEDPYHSPLDLYLMTALLDAEEGEPGHTRPSAPLRKGEDTTLATVPSHQQRARLLGPCRVKLWCDSTDRTPHRVSPGIPDLRVCCVVRGPAAGQSWAAQCAWHVGLPYKGEYA